VRTPPATKPAAKVIMVEDRDCESEFMVATWAKLAEGVFPGVILAPWVVLAILLEDGLLFVLLVPLVPFD
jgi:hypothetical protein